MPFLDNPLRAVPSAVAEHVIQIQLDVPIAPQLHLRDTFEWDLTNPDNSPEEFAVILVNDFLRQEKPEDLLDAATGQLEWLEKTVALEIRRIIDLNVMKSTR